MEDEDDADADDDEDASFAQASARWRLCARSPLDPPPSRSGGRACLNLVASLSNIKFPTLLKGPRGRNERSNAHGSQQPYPTSITFST